MNLVISRTNRKLYALNGSPTSLPTFFFGDSFPLTLQFLDELGFTTAGQNYQVVNYNGSQIRVAIGIVPDAVNNASELVLQNAFVWNAMLNNGTATLALNTQALLNALAHNASGQFYFEIKVITGAITETLLQQTCTVAAPVDNPANLAPPVVDQYLTLAQALAMFVKYIGGAGQTITLTSPSGAHTRELGVDDNGQPIDNET